MADELAQVETTAIEETQEQTPVETTENAVEETGRGDLNQALREEREKRQALEASLKDPNFIYSQARSLGLTEEEAQAQAEAPTQTPGSAISYNDYQYFKSMDKAKERFPQLNTDADDQIAITALMRVQNLLPEQAAEKYYKKHETAAEKARIEGAKIQETVVTDKERAQTVSSTVNTTSESAEYEAIVARTRNQMNPKDATKAHLELVKWKMAHNK